MGRRGPAPKPTHLKVMEGNPGKRRLPKNEPTPEVALPECPDHLSDEAKREWTRISPLLLGLGLLSRIDRAALAGYCQAWGRWVEAEEGIQKHGAIVKSPNGHPIQSPYLNVANRALKQMKDFLTLFGMTPASRAGLEVRDKPADESPMAKLLRGSK